MLLKGREEKFAGSRLRACHEVRRGHENRRGSAVQYPGEDLQGMDRSLAWIEAQKDILDSTSLQIGFADHVQRSAILLDIQHAENKADYKRDSKQEEGPSLPRFIMPE